MDTIADFLIRIKNAQAAQHQTVEVPFSKTKFAIAKILLDKGLILGMERKGVKSKERLEIKLKYNENKPAITEARRISKPGQRLYARSQDIKPVKQGYGLAIISTSQGIMTDQEARKRKIGGEILCEIW